DRDAAFQEGLADPLGSPSRELALVLGVAPGEPLVVEDLSLEQAPQRRLDLVHGEPAALQPQGQLMRGPLLAIERAERRLESVCLRHRPRPATRPSAPPRPRAQPPHPRSGLTSRPALRWGWRAARSRGSRTACPRSRERSRGS